MGKPKEDDEVQKGRPRRHLGKHEREAYDEVCSTIIQSTTVRQIKSMDPGNKSATDYIAKFDEYLNRCGAIELESPEQTLSRFWSGLIAESSLLEASRL